jgi:alpha-ketoglutaric semialdehyde dehydrogenase
MQSLELDGVSLIGGEVGEKGTAFYGVNPATGEQLEPAFFSATDEDVHRACELATEAAPAFSALSNKERAAFLRSIADALAAETDVIVARANAETGLPLPRLQGEVGRTTGQLRLFADVVEEGSWVDARIDEALPERKPLPRSDLRSMLRPLGPVAVFGASNFPLAFSVAGGDTASALAAGNPVVVKAHPAHPGTSELVGRLIASAVAKAGLPAGVFSLLFDSGIDVGVALVKHSVIKAVAFTGSGAGGQSLMKLAAARPDPIPVYAEMGSTNPLFILPGAMKERGGAIAAGLQGSFTLGSGQFCTKPGLVFVPQDSSGFEAALAGGVAELPQGGMLTHGIAAKFTSAVEARVKSAATVLSESKGTKNPTAAAGLPTVFSVDLKTFLGDPELEEEIFGPTTLLIHTGGLADMVAAAEELHGHLTATIHGTDEDLADAGELIRALERKVGRILINGYPTGVEVCHAMVHGGPFPACSDSRTTSVGSRAIYRFARPVCYQDFPDVALPPELQRVNALGVQRMVNGVLQRS